MNNKRKARLNASKYYHCVFGKLPRKQKKKIKTACYKVALNNIPMWNTIEPFYPLAGGQELPKKVFNFKEITVHGINKYNT
jgi:hypothetical protein